MIVINAPGEGAEGFLREVSKLPIDQPISPERRAVFEKDYGVILLDPGQTSDKK